MFKKLRIQFVTVIMVSVALVLAVVFTGICVAEYQRSKAEVDQALTESVNRVTESYQMSLNSGGYSGDRSDDAFSGGPGSGMPEFSGPPDKPHGNGGRDFAGPRIGGDNSRIVPVAVYIVEENNTYTIASEFTTAQIDSDVLASAADVMAMRGDGLGTIPELGLHYEKRTTEISTYVAFADVSTTSSWQSTAVSLAIAALAILAVFFVIALFLSKWALRPVREAWDAQRQFVADASHELKTPLTVVLANNSILLKHPGDTIASQSQWIESTQVEAENMQGLINEMLEMAQVESRAAIHHEKLDFSYLVDGLSLQFESVAFERGCMLETSIEEDITVDGDEARLRKAVSTLIENALKYVNEDGTVNVSLKRAGKNARLAINNTGSVISEENRAHIFDRFYRTDKARTSGTGGYGLGLAIAREIAREHEGDIICESDEAHGTTFIVTIPIAT